MVSNFIPLWWANKVCLSLIIFNLWRLVLWPCQIWSILESVMYVLEENKDPALIGWRILWVSLRSCWFIVVFKSSIFIFTFYLVIPSLIGNGGNESLQLIWLICLFSLQFCHLYFLYFGVLLFILIIFSD